MKNKVLMITIEIIVALVVGLGVFFIVRNNKNDNKVDTNNKEILQKEDTDSKAEIKKDTKKTNFLDDDKSYYFSIDGKKYYAGDKISDLQKEGFTLREIEKTENAPAGKYVIGAGHMVNSEDVTCFSVTPYNIKETDLTIEETVIGGLTLENFSAKKDEKALNIEVYGGIKLGSTKDEVEKVFGTTDDITIGDTYTVYKYNSKEVYRSFKIRFDQDDVVDTIEWKNLVFNK